MELRAELGATATDEGAAGQRLGPEARAAVSACIRTTKAVRHFLPDAIGDDVLRDVLEHATKAGSGSNRQPWRFVVVDDPADRARLGDWYREGWAHLVENGYTSKTLEAPTAAQQRVTAAAEHLADHFEEAPVVVVVCFLPHPTNPPDIFAGASVFPAIQNLLLAARSVGLGAVLTTMQAITFLDTTGAPTRKHEYFERLVALVGAPPGVVPVAVIPMGWPGETFGEGRRKPVEAVTFHGRYGTPWPPS